MRKIDRKSVYLISSAVIILLLILQAFLPTYNDVIKALIYNPYWAIAVGFFELYIQKQEAEDAIKNEKKIAKIKAVLNDGRNEHDSSYLLAIIEGLDDDMSNDAALRHVQQRLNRDDSVSEEVSSPIIE